MASSTTRALLRDLVATGRLPPATTDAPPEELVQEATAQGMAGLLLGAIESAGPEAAAPLRERLAARRRADLVSALARLSLAARALGILESRGVRALPMKGAALAETVYALESDRPMTDVDVLALDRFPAAVAALREAGFEEVARADHAWAFRDPGGGGLLELHRSVVSAPGLFPLDGEGVWARRRRGHGQVPRLPSAEDLLVQISLHAAFQHGLVLALVQWLDFRRLLEAEPPDPARLRAAAAASRAEVPLAAALRVAAAVAGARVPRALDGALPRGLERWLAPRLARPLAFVSPAQPELRRVRWELLAGRRAALLWRTLVLPEAPGGDARLPARLAAAIGRGLRLARGAPGPRGPRPRR